MLVVQSVFRLRVFFWMNVWSCALIPLVLADGCGPFTPPSQCGDGDDGDDEGGGGGGFLAPECPEEEFLVSKETSHDCEPDHGNSKVLNFHVRPVRKRNVGARCAKLIKLIYDEATMLRA